MAMKNSHVALVTFIGTSLLGFYVYDIHKESRRIYPDSAPVTANEYQKNLDSRVSEAEIELKKAIYENNQSMLNSISRSYTPAEVGEAADRIAREYGYPGFKSRYPNVALDLRGAALLEISGFMRSRYYVVQKAREDKRIQEEIQKERDEVGGYPGETLSPEDRMKWSQAFNARSEDDVKRDMDNREAAQRKADQNERAQQQVKQFETNVHNATQDIGKAMQNAFGGKKK